MPFVLRQLSIPLMGIMLVTLVSCNGYDGEYFPYAMTGLNVWVYDKEVSKEWFVGFVKSSYFSRSEGASQCAVLQVSMPDSIISRIGGMFAVPLLLPTVA